MDSYYFPYYSTENEYNYEKIEVRLYLNPKYDKKHKEIELKYNIKEDSTKFLFTNSYRLPNICRINPSKAYAYHNPLSVLYINIDKKINKINNFLSLKKKNLYFDKEFRRCVDDLIEKLDSNSTMFWYFLNEYYNFEYINDESYIIKYGLKEKMILANNLLELEEFIKCFNENNAKKIKLLNKSIILCIIEDSIDNEEIINKENLSDELENIISILNLNNKDFDKQLLIYYITRKDQIKRSDIIFELSKQLKDINKVKKCSLIAVLYGNSNAMTNLGKHYKENENNYEEMIKYYQMAIDFNNFKNSSKIMIYLAIYYKNIDNINEMRKYYQMAIQTNNFKFDLFDDFIKSKMNLNSLKIDNNILDIFLQLSDEEIKSFLDLYTELHSDIEEEINNILFKFDSELQQNNVDLNLIPDKNNTSNKKESYIL